MYVLVSGGLIAPPSDRPRLLKEFLQFTRARNWRPIFFCVPEEDMWMFREAGLPANKIGEDPLLDLERLTFSGKKYEWVRRQKNYCERHGVTVREVDRDELSEAEWESLLSELEDVCAGTMDEKAQGGELQFFDGTLGEHDLGHRRLFLAETHYDGRRRIEGYVVCNPMRNGQAWSTEIYRHRADAVRGTVAFLFHQIALQMKEERVEQISLCIAPGRNCEEPIPNEKPLVRKSLLWFRKRGSALFDMQGICYFKSRFRPRYENCYVCLPPDARMFPKLVAFGGVLATAWAIGVWRINPFKLLRLCWRKRRRT
jgi:phosphatidylglycerol lysyltransferase